MSRNLCRDNCDCGYVFGIKDFVGQPVEFRKYFSYAPHIGAKITCPECNKVYFGWFLSGYEYWGTAQEEMSRAFNDEFDRGDGCKVENKQKGKFVMKANSIFSDTEELQDLGYYHIDLSYYETFNDEGEGIDTATPSHLCTEDDERTRWYQTNEISEEI